MTSRRIFPFATTMALALVGAACSGSGGEASAGSITLMTHDSFATTDGIFAEFETANHVKVAVVKGQDAGVVLNQAILTKGKPEGDVLWGVDNTLLSRAQKAKVFSPYASPALADLDPTLASFVPAGHEATPVDRGDVCVNVAKAAFEGKSLQPPATFDDLVDPKYKDQLVVENPATSSPGLAFLLATRAQFGDKWLDYWKKLKANGVKIADGWTTAYTVDFAGSSGKGPRSLVVSYGTSPAAELGDDGRAGTTAIASTCFAQVEYVGVLAGTKRSAMAHKLVDFLLSKTFQQDMPNNMYVFPARKDATVPAAFETFGIRPPKPLALPAADIDSNREAWIAAWSALMLS